MVIIGRGENGLFGRQSTVFTTGGLVPLLLIHFHIAYQTNMAGVRPHVVEDL